jgi:ribosomal protein S18 acetylase RimI-like enzyme
MIRQATQNDLDAIEALELACFQSDRFTRRSFSYLLTKAKASVYVAEKNNAILGCIILLHRLNSASVRIYSLAVYPRARKSGIGRELIKFAENDAIRNNKRYLVLEVRQDNQTAINFYLQNGYEVFSFYNEYYEDGMQALRLRKILRDK